jgi:hypothetical protein
MKWITRAVVVAPICHIALCYYYMFLRSFGFGSNVSEFIAPGDVFTVGLSKLLSTYLIFVLTFVFAYLWMDADPLKVVGRTEFNRHPDLERPSTKFLFELFPYIAGLGVLVSVLKKQLVPLVIVITIFVPLISNIFIKIFDKNKIAPIWRVPAVMIALGLLNLSASAYSEGFKFRHKPFEYFSSSYAKCSNGTLVLFSSGERYVGITPSGDRILMTKECVKNLQFPNSKVVLDVM